MSVVAVAAPKKIEDANRKQEVLLDSWAVRCPYFWSKLRTKDYLLKWGIILQEAHTCKHMYRLRLKGMISVVLSSAGIRF